MKYEVTHKSYTEKNDPINRTVIVEADKWSTSYGRTVFTRDFVDHSKEPATEVTLPVAEFPSDNVWSIVAIIEDTKNEEEPDSILPSTEG